MDEKSDLAIIGAGAAGLAAAWQTSRYGMRSTIFEKSRGLSGRAATRHRHGSHFDHGANFFRLENPRVESLLRQEICTDGLAQIPGEVWTFDHQGQIRRGDPAQNAIPKFTYRQGISMVGKHLLAATPLTEVHYQVRIGEISRRGKNWALIGDQGILLGEWPRLLLTPPPPQTAEILSASQLAPDLATHLASLAYHPQFTLVLAFDSPILPSRNFHALVNSDQKHAVAWLSFEEDKPNHVTCPGSILIAQMSPGWSADHDEIPADDWRLEVTGMIEELLGVSLPETAWWDSQHWRYAHPRPGPGLPPKIRKHYENEGLFLAGDGLFGKGRLPLALQSGLETADQICSHFPKK